MRLIVTTIVVCLLLAASSFASTIHVPGDYPTIQQAISAAGDSDEIIVGPGTYTSTSLNVIDTQSKSLYIHSSNGPSATIIDGQDKRRCILIAGGSPTIEGFTIINGYAEYGAGIRCEYSGPSIRNCLIRDNYSFQSAGGIHCFYGSSPAIYDCSIVNNYAGMDGGGIASTFSGSPSIIDNCVIAYNYAAEEGGGIYFGSPNLVSTLVCGNVPDNISGGWNDGGGSVVSIVCDCNANEEDDLDEIAGGSAQDCNGNLVLDECDIDDGIAFDCNVNNIPDACDVDSGTSDDLDSSGIPDECECLADATFDGVVDVDDVLIVIALWGNTGSIGDVNYDGIVDVNDLLYVINSWGACP